MTHNINFPKPPEYYIAWSGTITNPIVAYGYVNSFQCLETGLDNLEIFYDKPSYEARLMEFGIQITDLI